MADAFDPYYTWLGIPPEEQPPDHYRLLGIRPFEEQADVIENADEQRLTHLRSRSAGSRVRESQRLLNEVAQARLCLLNADLKRSYDERLRTQQVSSSAFGASLSEKGQVEQPLEAELVPMATPPAVASGGGPTNWVRTAAPHAPPQTTNSSERKVPLLLAIGGVLAVLIIGGAIVLATHLNRPSDPDVPQQAGTAADSMNPRADPASPPGTNLISLFDPQHVNRGSMSKYESGLQTDTELGACQTYFAGFEAPRNYKLVAEVTREAGHGAIVFGIVVRGQPCNLVIDNLIQNEDFQGYRSGLVAIDNLILDDAACPWTHELRLLSNGKKSRIECIVRGTEVTASVDGYEFVHWVGNPSRLSRKTFYTPQQDAFAIGSWRAVYRITRLEIQPLTGE